MDPSFFTTQAATLPNGQPNPTVGQVNPYGVLAYNRIIPIDPAPQYYEGYCTPTVANTTTYQGATLTTPASVTNQYHDALLLIENPVNPANLIPNPPTSWFWNVRVGDKIQLNNSGPWYTVIGPMVVTPSQGNPDLFVNVGLPAPLANLASAVPNLTYPNGQSYPVEFLVLVNGQDDNNNGWADEGFDGIDNDNDGLTDEVTCTLCPSDGEWETETWLGNVLTARSPRCPTRSSGGPTRPPEPGRSRCPPRSSSTPRRFSAPASDRGCPSTSRRATTA